MRLAVVAAVLVVLLACVVALKAAPSARDEAELREAVGRQAKRELKVFARAPLPDEDQSAMYKRNILQMPYPTKFGYYGVRYPLIGKRDVDHADFQQ